MADMDFCYIDGVRLVAELRLWTHFQTLNHITSKCLLHALNGTLLDFHNITPEATSWMQYLDIKL